MKTKALVCMLVLIGASEARAETMADHPAFRALYNVPMVKIGYNYHFKTNVDDSPASIGISSIHSMGTLPLYRWGGGAIAMKARYFLNIFQLRNADGDIMGDGDYMMHQVGLALGFSQTLSERWMLTIGLMPNLSSDFSELDTHAFFMEGRAETGWAYSDSLSFRFGVAVHSRFGMYLPIPMLGLAYRPRDSFFEFYAFIPKILRATFRATDHLDLEVFGRLDNYVWDVNQENLKDLGRYMKVMVGAGVKVRLWNGLYLRISGGIIPYCRLESYGASEDPSVEDHTTTDSFVPFLGAEFFMSPREWMQTSESRLPGASP